MAPCCEADAAVSPWWHVWDATPFMPRWKCGAWSDGMVAAWVVPSTLLLMLYLTVAGVALAVWRGTRGTAGPRWALPWVALMFVGCGGGHFLNALSFAWPAYRAFIVWDVLTLAWSAVATAGVVKGMRWELRRVKQLKRERDFEAGAAAEARGELAEVQATIREGESQLEAFRHELGKVKHQLKNEENTLRLTRMLNAAEAKIRTAGGQE